MSAILLQVCAEAAKFMKCGSTHEVTTKWQEVTTNWQDVIIVFLICSAVTIIATYSICRFFTSREKEWNDQKQSESTKHEWEEKEKICKLKAELQNKLLDFQKELAFPYEKKSGGGFEKKDYDPNASEKYQKTLISLLEKYEPTSQQPQE